MMCMIEIYITAILIDMVDGTTITIIIDMMDDVYCVVLCYCDLIEDQYFLITV